MKEFTIKKDWRQLEVNLSNNGLIEIILENTLSDDWILININPKETNGLITHLVNLMKEINEPIDVLN